MHEQAEKHYNGTLTTCIAARCARNRAHILLDVEDLQAYLQEVVNHHASALDLHFEFARG